MCNKKQGLLFKNFKVTLTKLFKVILVLLRNVSFKILQLFETFFFPRIIQRSLSFLNTMYTHARTRTRHTCTHTHTHLYLVRTYSSLIYIYNSCFEVISNTTATTLDVVMFFQSLSRNFSVARIARDCLSFSCNSATISKAEIKNARLSSLRISDIESNKIIRCYKYRLVRYKFVFVISLKVSENVHVSYIHIHTLDAF